MCVEGQRVRNGGDNGVTSGIEAPAGEDGSKAEGGEAEDLVDRLMERADMAAWIEAFSQSGGRDRGQKA